MEICGHPTAGSQAKPEEHQLENLSVIFTGTIGFGGINYVCTNEQRSPSLGHKSGLEARYN